jgi:hypothetical protein
MHTPRVSAMWDTDWSRNMSTNHFTVEYRVGLRIKP